MLNNAIGGSPAIRSAAGPGGFPNPFNDVASLSIPRSQREMLYWAEYIFGAMGTYRMAAERINAYFLTDVEFTDGSDEEKEKYQDLYENVLDYFSLLQHAQRDRACYGNGFMSFVIPFRRWLRCPKCGSTWPLDVVYENKSAFNFDWSDCRFVASCPECAVGGGYRGELSVDDKQDDLERKLKLKWWSPHEIDILHDPYTHDCAYLWRIPEDYKMLVRQGHLYQLQRVPLKVLSAIRHNAYFRFHDDILFHMKEPCLGGIRNRGWGLPRILTNYRQIWYVQVLRRMNEAIALDYVIPLRLITPEVRAGASAGGDPLSMYNGGDASAQIRRMLRQRRYDPASWHTLPFPVRYSVAGGDANQLAPRDLLDQGYETLLNDSGTPVELYKGTLQLQAAPVALRLFEATWHQIPRDNNAFLRWSLRWVSKILGWETISGRHKRVTVADDIQKQMMMLQLMTAQQLSGTTGLKAIGADWKEEQRLKVDEAKATAELQARAQEEMSQAGFSQQIAKGQATQGGAGVTPGGQTQQQQPAQGQGQAGQQPQQTYPVDDYLQGYDSAQPRMPQETMAVADGLAQALLGLPETVKDSQLRKLKAADLPTHSMVKAYLDHYRKNSRAQTAGAPS